MSELNYITLLLIGFCSYPVIKFIVIAVFDKIVSSIEAQVVEELDVEQ